MVLCIPCIACCSCSCAFKSGMLISLHTKSLKQKKRIPSTPTAKINHHSSAIENFLVQNAMIKNHRKIAPLSGVEHGFILLTERNLVTIFSKSELLRPLLFDLARQSHFRATSVKDLKLWIGTKEPGYLIRRLLVHVGKEDQDPMHRKTKEERKRLKSYKGGPFNFFRSKKYVNTLQVSAVARLERMTPKVTFCVEVSGRMGTDFCCCRSSSKSSIQESTNGCQRISSLLVSRALWLVSTTT